MSPQPAILFEEDLRIPAEVFDFVRFRGWCQGGEFPERGRIDFLDGEVYVDMSPENLYFHGRVKTAIAVGLHAAIEDPDLGAVYIDRTRVVSPSVGLSVEPDVIALLWHSLETGKVREIEAARAEDGFVELEGAPDLIVEILSNSSEKKDLERLPELYAKAGVRELWLVDARGESLSFQIHDLGSDGSYSLHAPDAEGYSISRVLNSALRLTRRSSGPLHRPVYKLERL
jgi:Uma2 family endonuclease